MHRANSRGQAIPRHVAASRFRYFVLLIRAQSPGDYEGLAQGGWWITCGHYVLGARMPHRTCNGRGRGRRGLLRIVGKMASAGVFSTESTSSRSYGPVRPRVRRDGLAGIKYSKEVILGLSDENGDPDTGPGADVPVAVHVRSRRVRASWRS